MILNDEKMVANLKHQIQTPHAIYFLQMITVFHKPDGHLSVFSLGRATGGRCVHSWQKKKTTFPSAMWPKSTMGRSNTSWGKARVEGGSWALLMAVSVFRWLFEGVSRVQAEQLLFLRGNRVGSFLIRESSAGVYSCCGQTTLNLDVFQRSERESPWYGPNRQSFWFSLRHIQPLHQTQSSEALPHQPSAKQLVLHLPTPHLPVPRGPGQPLFW